jgi:hypothetical protein
MQTQQPINLLQAFNPLQCFNERAAANLMGISESNLKARRARRLVPFTRVGSRVLYTAAHIFSILEAGQESPVAPSTRT